MSTCRFVYFFTPSLYDMDAAGVMFFGHLFRHVHDAYEAFLSHTEYPLAGILDEGRYHLPIVHTEADYRQPIRHAQALQIELLVENVEKTRFSIDYRIVNEHGEELATARTVHVCIHPLDRRRTALPKALQSALRSTAG